MNIYI